jgi:hypothetical protein
MSDPTSPKSTPNRVRQVAVPSATRSLNTLSPIDYQNALLGEIDAAQDR